MNDKMLNTQSPELSQKNGMWTAIRTQYYMLITLTSTRTLGWIFVKSSLRQRG